MTQAGGDCGNGGLHVARAGRAAFPARSAHRHLGVRLRAVRDADREPCVRWSATFSDTIASVLRARPPRLGCARGGRAGGDIAACCSRASREGPALSGCHDIADGARRAAPTSWRSPPRSAAAPGRPLTARDRGQRARRATALAADGDRLWRFGRRRPGRFSRPAAPASWLSGSIPPRSTDPVGTRAVRTAIGRSPSLGLVLMALTSRLVAISSARFRARCPPAAVGPSVAPGRSGRPTAAPSGFSLPAG